MMAIHGYGNEAGMTAGDYALAAVALAVVVLAACWLRWRRASGASRSRR